MRKILAVVLFASLTWAVAPALPQSFSSWLVGGNSVPNTSSLGTTSDSDISLITNGAESGHLYAGSGVTRLALTFNPLSEGTPFLPKNEAQLEVFGTPTGIPYDQLALHGTSTTYRRSAIIFDSNCQPGTLASCVGNNNNWVQEFEIGVDLAPNGGHNFFLYDEVDNGIRMLVSSTGQIGFGTTAPLGTVAGEITAPRLNVSGAAPACSATNAGTNATCTLEGGSTDSAGAMIITAGSTAGSSGFLTLTYSQPLGTHAPVCTVTPWDDSGTWFSRVALKAFNRSTAATVFNWNNVVSLTENQTYGVMYVCVGK